MGEKRRKKGKRERADCGNERRKKKKLKNGAGYKFLFNEELQ